MPRPDRPANGEEDGPQPVHRGGSAPLSYNQEHLWFIDQLTQLPNNVPTILDLLGPLDVGALRRSLAEVLKRHEVLRSTILLGSDGLTQQVTPFAEPDLPLRELGEEQIDGALTDEIDHRFKLDQGPLWRAALLRVAPQHHLFILTAHHIVCDGLSSRIIEGEIADAYQAFSSGEPSPLGPPPIQYADFAIWQRSWLKGPRLEEELAFWRRALAGSPAGLELPYDRPRKSGTTHHRAIARRALPSSLAEAVQALGRSAGCTPFMTYLAAVAALLHRHTGESDLVIGTPVSVRETPELLGLVGYFANPLMARIDVSGQPGFRQLLERTRRATLDLLRHRDAPADRILPPLQQQLLAQLPYRVQLHFDDEGYPARRAGALVLERREPPWSTLLVDLVFNIFATRDQGREIVVSYDPSRFDAATASLLAEHFEWLLRSVTEHPSAPIGQLPCASAAEEQLVTRQWCGTSDAGTEPTLEALLRARDGERLALVHGERRMSHGELEARSARVAAALRRRGLRRGAIVGVAIERSPDQVVALLGIVRSGAAWLPLEPDQPPGRTAQILKDAAPALILDRRLLQQLLDADGDNLEPIEARPDDAAYVVYTSGSTGRPKGVVGTHRGLVNRVRDIQATWPFRDGETACQMTPLGFVDSIAATFAPLLAGIPLVLIDREIDGDGERIIDELQRTGVTRIVVVPSRLEALLAAENLDDRLASLTTCTVSGEALSPRLRDRFFAALPGRRLINLYGSSEVSADVTGAEMTREGPVTIGRPLPGCRVYVLDDALGPLPIGAVGEIYVGGKGLARGYLGDAARTAERFLPDPWVPGARIYRTGDRARWRWDGALELVGRADRQIKLRGVRIEPREVEWQLLELPNIRDAAVVLQVPASGEPRLVAYLVGGEASESELRTRLREQLPEAAVPARIFFVPAIPRLPNGKPDRLSLPPPDEKRTAREHAPPVTPDERALAVLWEELLAVSPVGLDDDFATLGGHSLLAAQLVARASRAMGVELTVRHLLARPTVRGLAEEVARQRAAGPQGQPIRQRGDRSRFPLLPQQLAAAPRHSLLHWFGSLHGKVDPAALRRAIGGVVERHAILRATIEEGSGGRLEQRVHPASPELCPLDDLTALPEDEAQRVASDAERAALETRVALARGPLFQARILSLRHECRLLLSAHHAVADARSLALILSEVGATYAASLGQGAPPAEPAYDAFDYAAWREDFAASDAGQAATAWWLSRLRSAPPLILPADEERRGSVSRRRKETPGTAFAADEVPWHLPAGTVDRLTRRWQAEGATAAVGWLAHWFSAIQRLTAQTDVTIGVFDEGRAHPGLEAVIGPLFQILPVRVELDGPLSEPRLLARVGAALLEARQHGDVTPPIPIGRVSRVAFNLRQWTAPGVSGLELAQRATPASQSVGAFDLNLRLWRDSTGDLQGSVRFNRELLERGLVEELVAQLQERALRGA